MLFTARVVALHSALWGFDRWYRASWYLWPAAMAMLIAGWICIDKPAGTTASAYPWGKPLLGQMEKQAVNPGRSNTIPKDVLVHLDLDRCFGKETFPHENLGACDALINIWHLKGAQLAAVYTRHGFLQRETDPVRAMADYHSALMTQADYPDALSGRAWLYMNRGDYEAAVADLDKAVAAAALPESIASARYYRGYAHFKLQHYEAALADLNEAQKLQPDNADVYFARGKTQQALENYEAALRDFDEFAKRAPSDARGQASRGSVLEAMGRSTEALSAFESAVRLEPSNAYAVSERDRLREQQDEDDKSKTK